MEKTSERLIYLMACSLQGTKPEGALLANIDMEALLRLAKAHSVSAMACMALEQTDEFQHAAETTRLKWTGQQNKAVRKNMLAWMPNGTGWKKNLQSMVSGICR